MISKKKKLEIANVCYANVSGNFAMFCNPKFRGENFTWAGFILDCEMDADLWMLIHNVGGKDIREVNELARQYSKEIAESLVRRLSNETT